MSPTARTALFGELKRIINGLPDAGQHKPDARHRARRHALYQRRPTCNACTETNPESATVLQMKRTANRTIFAKGLRNTIGFAFHPETGKFWGPITASIGSATMSSPRRSI